MVGRAQHLQGQGNKQLEQLSEDFVKAQNTETDQLEQIKRLSDAQLETEDMDITRIRNSYTSKIDAHEAVIVAEKDDRRAVSLSQGRGSGFGWRGVG